MMHQPLRRVDPLGRSAPSVTYTPNDAWLTPGARGSAWPISRGSMRPIVDTPFMPGRNVPGFGCGVPWCERERAPHLLQTGHG